MSVLFCARVFDFSVVGLLGRAPVGSRGRWSSVLNRQCRVPSVVGTSFLSLSRRFENLA